MNESVSNSPHKGTLFSETRTLQCGAAMLNLASPVVMGILNVTPDSFYDGGKYNNPDSAVARAAEMIGEGAEIIDIGAVSTRPGSNPVSETEEADRLISVIEIIATTFPQIIISADTYRASVAKQCIKAGAGIINDISGSLFDPLMAETVAKSDVAYVMMHIQGTPETMQLNPTYNNVITEVTAHFSQLLSHPGFSQKHNIVLDPGFGFGKRPVDNYKLLHDLSEFTSFGLPVLAGISRKSMITKELGTSAAKALNGTTVLNTIALLNGASILRVHDVREAVEAVKLVQALRQSALNS